MIIAVTGGGSGIGAAVCARLDRDGHTVGVLDVDLAAATGVAAGLRSATAARVDVSRPEQVDTAIAQLVREQGTLDGIVNVAGVDDPQVKAAIARHRDAGTPLEITSRLTDAAWRRMTAVNLDGVFYCIRTALRVMVPAGHGSIVSIASIAGLTGTAGMAHYAAAKAGVLALTRSVALEVADRGIRVNAIAPGGIDTPMIARSHSSLVGAIPLGRTADPDEVAGVVAFLLGPDSSFVTGETIAVCGGMVTM